MRMSYVILIAVVAIVSAAPQMALAYIGPGAGLSAIGTLLGLVGAVLLAIVGFVWYPVKRFLKKRRKAREATGQEADSGKK